MAYLCKDNRLEMKPRTAHHTLRLALLLLLLPPLRAVAQADADSVRLVSRATMLSVGVDNMLDTYLSPEKFNGLQLGFLSHVDRYHPGRLWHRTIVHRAAVAKGSDRAEDNDMLGAQYDMQYRWMRQIVKSDRLTVCAGVGATGHVGVLYLPVNGNNPVQIHAGVAALAAANAQYSFALGRVPLTVGYDISAPLLGVAFSPAYGQSYYELVSRGNYDHNVVVSQPFNAPTLRQMLTVDIKLKRLKLRLGYLGDYQQSKFNDIRYHEWQHLLLIGVVRELKIIK